MMRAAFVIGMIGLAQSSPVMAMPNAFWIFGFHVPGKQGAKSDVVMMKSPDRQLSRSTAGPATAPAMADRPAADDGDALDAKLAATS